MIRMLRRTWQRLLGSLPFRTPDVELAEELEAHIQLLAEENIRRGMAPEEAHRQARIKFGNVESMKERYRDQRGLPFLDTTAQDLRYAIRVLSKNRGFTTVAILSLAIGIGANTAIFSLVNGVLLRPLEYPDSDRLFAVREVQVGPSRGMSPVNPAHALAWANACPSITHVAVLRSSRGQLSATGSDPATLPGARVTHNFFTLLGVTPLLGRTFLAEEEQPGRDRVIILSEALWRARFNADPSVVGKAVLVDGVDHEVIGVVRGSFWRSFGGGIQNTPSDGRYELFRPLGFSAEELARVSGNYNYAALVRLKPGTTAEQAVAEMNVVQARFPRGLTTPGGLEAMLIPLRELVTGRSLGLWMLTAAVGAVLLIVCFNLANLLLSRAASRSRETAVRSALGAGRLRQFRQLLTESLVLAAAGGVLGVVFAMWSVQALAGSATVDLPRLGEVRVDPMVVLFAAGLTLLTTIVFAVVPAWRLTRGDPNEALRAGSRTVTETRSGLRLREGLIGLEVGLSTALLIVAALLTASLDRLLRVDKGFDVDQVLTFDLDTAGPAYAKPVERGQFFARVIEKIEALPGVEAAAITTQLPLEGNTWNDPIYLIENGSRSDRHPVDNRFTSPGFFRVMNIAIRHGRAFDDSDRDRSVAVLSVKAAQLLWPGEANPVGRQFMGEDDAVKTLVGVVADVRVSLHEHPPPHAYYPYWQRVPGDVVMVVRTSSGPGTMAAPIRAALRSEDPNLPLAPIRGMQDLVDGAVEQRRFQSTLVVVFAASAVLVASLGIYGVVAYSVTRRRNEIGIRMALGARRSQLLTLIVTQGMTPVALGIVAGITVALLLGRAIRGLLFDVQATDPATIATVTVILSVVGLIACLLPARRAIGTSTVDALRLE